MKEPSEIKYYVYEWYIVDTDEVFYVGKGCGDRYKTTRRNNKFFNDMYNSHECDVRILEDCLTEEEAYAKEMEWIAWYRDNTNYRLTNQTDGGDGTRGYKPSQETIEAQRQAIIDRWNNPEWKAKIIAARHDPSSTYQSDEFKKKISSLVQGENNPNYGNRWSEEQKDALRQKIIASGRYVGEKNPKAKTIQCVETGEIFSCITYAMRKYGVKCAASFTAALDKPTRTAAGLHWITLSNNSRNAQ